MCKLIFVEFTHATRLVWSACRVMYKDAGQAIILATVATGHEWSLNGLHENNVNHMQWPSQSQNLNPIEHSWEILERFPPTIKHDMMEFLVEEWCRIRRIELQTLVQSIPKCIEAVLVRGGPTPY